jgi:hypothetical protein
MAKPIRMEPLVRNSLEIVDMMRLLGIPSIQTPMIPSLDEPIALPRRMAPVHEEFAAKSLYHATPPTSIEKITGRWFLRKGTARGRSRFAKAN